MHTAAEYSDPALPKRRSGLSSGSPSLAPRNYAYYAVRGTHHDHLISFSRARRAGVLTPLRYPATWKKSRTYRVPRRPRHARPAPWKRDGTNTCTHKTYINRTVTNNGHALSAGYTYKPVSLTPITTIIRDVVFSSSVLITFELRPLTVLASQV